MNPFRLEEVEAATQIALARGERVMQTHMYAPTPRAHCGALLSWMAPPANAVVVDMGCGVGEVAKHMASIRRDLKFLLVNVSPMQLAECPYGAQFVHLHGDAHDTQLPAGKADVVMFNSALVNMDWAQALREAARILKPSGVLFLNEMLRLHGDNSRFVEMLGAHVPTSAELQDLAEAAGLQLDMLLLPDHDDTAFRSKLGDQATLLDGVTTAVWRFIK